ncbi:MAG: recombination regulator RecX [Psychrobacter sp.]|uniref:regulatory protein RecX n=1 Tax=Psychrobacter sp. TaxID=56811 RepID=UPI0026473E37|nr:regulatory protein RecX [Psychrobacter sp.]MDN5619536.1 recombination regulator RecX [Psychrobacter sp.]
MKIKTLAEILAESKTGSASSVDSKRKKPTKHSYQNTSNKSGKSSKLSKDPDQDHSSTSEPTVDTSYFEESSAKIKKNSKSKKRKKRFHPAASFSPEPNDAPAYQPPKAQSIKEMLAEVKNSVHSGDAENDVAENDNYAPSFEQSECGSERSSFDDSEVENQNDNIPTALKAYLRTPEQKQAEIDAIKAESRLRWLAFYYLSRREYGKAELKQKLIDKEQDPEKIDALLDEFEEKGYQSDYRTTIMLIRENIRKGRGRGRIKQAFYQKKIAMPDNIDELIDMANAESEEFSEFVEDGDDNLVEGVDWLKLAVTARTKKYGNTLPREPKDKARQLRFLQYRGFNTDICFAALNYTLETLDERF